MLEPKYSEIIVELSGNDGNAFSILGICRRTAREAKMDRNEFEVFVTEATAGDYNDLIQTCMKWFTVA
jgi:hypothetical protein